MFAASSSISPRKASVKLAISGLEISSVEVRGFSKGVIRIRYDSHDIRIVDASETLYIKMATISPSACTCWTRSMTY